MSSYLSDFKCGLPSLYRQSTESVLSQS